MTPVPNSRLQPSHALLAATTLGLSLFVPTASAVDGTFIPSATPASVNWGTASNWSGNVIAEGNGATANIHTEFQGGARAITITGSNRTIGILDVLYNRTSSSTSTTRTYTFSSTDGSGFIFNNNGSNAVIRTGLFPDSGITTGGLVFNVPVVLQDNLQIDNDTTGTVTLSGSVSGTGGLIVNKGAATIGTSGINQNTNSYSGGTTINSGAKLTAIGGGNDSTYKDALGAANGVVTINGGTLATTGTTYFTNGRQFVLGSEGGTFETVGFTHVGSPDVGGNPGNTGSISGDGPLIKTGASTLAFYENTVNTYTGGTFINQGVIRVRADYNLGATTGAVTLNGGTLATQIAVVFDEARKLVVGQDGGTINAGYTNVNNHVDWNGIVEGSGELTKIGAAIFSLNNENNTHSGGILVSDGTLRIRGGDGSLGALNNALTLQGGSSFSIDHKDGDHTTLNNQRVINLQRITVIVNEQPVIRDRINFITTTNATIHSSIEGNGILVKQGDGVLELTENNIYSGGTEVQAGTLLVNNTEGFGTGTGDVRVLNGGTLGGGGSIFGDTTLESGSILAANGNLRFSNDLNLGGITRLSIGGQTRGVGYDAINVGGLMTFGGDFEIIFTSALSGNYTYDLFQMLGGYSGSFNSVSLTGFYVGSLVNNGSGIWTGESNGVNFTFDQSLGTLGVVVPEPSTIALMLGGAAAGFALIARRRKQRRA